MDTARRISKAAPLLIVESGQRWLAFEARTSPMLAPHVVILNNGEDARSVGFRGAERKLEAGQSWQTAVRPGSYALQSSGRTIEWQVTHEPATYVIPLDGPWTSKSHELNTVMVRTPRTFMRIDGGWQLWPVQPEALETIPVTDLQEAKSLSA